MQPFFGIVGFIVFWLLLFFAVSFFKSALECLQLASRE